MIKLTISELKTNIGLVRKINMNIYTNHVLHEIVTVSSFNCN